MNESLLPIFDAIEPRGRVDAPNLECHLARLARWAQRTRPEAWSHQVAVAFRHYKRKIAK